jgi:hypothetical protein
MDNDDTPATKRHLQNLKAEITEELTEVIRDSDTRLLNAFYTFAESNQKRLAGIENESAAIKSWLATVEQRLLDVEKRLNMPPQTY